MSDGDIFKYQDALLLQLGELEGNPEAPFAGFCKNDAEQIQNCDPELPKFYIPKSAIKGLLSDHAYINLAGKSISLIPLSKVAQMQHVTTLSYSYMNAINRCALTRDTVRQKIKPYLRTNRH